jgi:hypothetical protein
LFICSNLDGPRPRYLGGFFYKFPDIPIIFSKAFMLKKSHLVFR